MRATSLKWGKREKESHLVELQQVLHEGGTLAFISNKPSLWTILIAEDSSFTDISISIAGLTDRFVVGCFLKELKYDSPDVLINDLKGVMGYTTPFKIQVFGEVKPQDVSSD